MRAASRSLVFGFVTACGLAAASESAQAQTAPAVNPRDKSNSQFTLHREEAGGANGNAARARARAGDCAGALPSFDAAIRSTIEPTLRRDRGLCHEKLGNVYPAIADYRAYLTARADAPDADQIRDRLQKLEDQVNAGGPSAVAVRERDDPNGFALGSQFSLGNENNTAAVAADEGKKPKNDGKDTKSEDVLGPKPGETDKSYDYYVAQERIASAADTSPLRYGKGWEFGPSLSVPRYYVGKAEGTTTASGAGYAVAASLRYSFGSVGTFILEGGFTGLGNSADQKTPNGPMVMAGVEARFALDKWASNQLVLGLGPGFERYTLKSETGGIDAVVARARFGYRHVFGPAVGLEFLLDGGPAVLLLTGVPDGTPHTSQLVGMISGTYALVIGF